MPSSIQDVEQKWSDFANGDVNTFRIIYNTYFTKVYLFSQKYIQGSQAAEDVASEVFLTLWNKRADFASLQHMQRFLYVCTRNACLNYLRSEKRRMVREQEVLRAHEHDAQHSFENDTVREHIYNNIYQLVERLPYRERCAFKMFYIEGLCNEEVSLKMHISQQSVRNLKCRVIAKIKLLLHNSEYSPAMFFALNLLLRDAFGK